MKRAIVLVLLLGCKSTAPKRQAEAPRPAAVEAKASVDGGVAADAGPAAAEGAATPTPTPTRTPTVEKGKAAPHVVDGRKLVMVGQGARVVDGEKLYDMQMWIDDQDGRRAFPALAMRAGGKSHALLTRGEHAPAFLVWGRFSKQAVIKFAKDVPAATMRAELKSALEGVKGADELLALVGDASAGDEWLLTTRDNGEIELTVGDETRQAPQSPRLQRALWNVWLGAHPLSNELRRELVDKIDVLR